MKIPITIEIHIPNNILELLQSVLLNIGTTVGCDTEHNIDSNEAKENNKDSPPIRLIKIENVEDKNKDGNNRIERDNEIVNKELDPFERDSKYWSDHRGYLGNVINKFMCVHNVDINEVSDITGVSVQTIKRHLCGETQWGYRRIWSLITKNLDREHVARITKRHESAAA